MPTRFAGLRIVEPRLLHHPAAAFDQRHLARDLVIQRLLQEAEGVQILHFGLGAELLRALQPHRDVGVAAQVALFHVAGGDFDELQHLLQLREVGVGLVGAAHVGLADDLDQRRAAAVQVHVGVAVGIVEAVVDALAGIVFHVDARDADALGRAVDHDIDDSRARPAARRIARSGSPWAGRDRSSSCARNANAAGSGN